MGSGICRSPRLLATLRTVPTAWALATQIVRVLSQMWLGGRGGPVGDSVLGWLLGCRWVYGGCGADPTSWSTGHSYVELRAGLCCCRRVGRAAGSSTSHGVWSRDARGCCHREVLGGGKGSLWLPLLSLGLGVSVSPDRVGRDRCAGGNSGSNLGSFGDRWIPGIPDSPRVKKSQSAHCPGKHGASGAEDSA